MNKLFFSFLVFSLSACGSSMKDHAEILRDDLKRVKYEDGITLLEAKSIADAYLYLHGKKIGNAPHVKVSDGGDVWLGDIYGGVAVSPERVDSPPVEVDKQTGQVFWPEGPAVVRVELPDEDRSTLP